MAALDESSSNLFMIDEAYELWLFERRSCGSRTPALMPLLAPESSEKAPSASSSAEESRPQTNICPQPDLTPNETKENDPEIKSTRLTGSTCSQEIGNIIQAASKTSSLIPADAAVQGLLVGYLSIIDL